MNETLKKTIEDKQKIITNGDSALQDKCELIKVKDELISNLKNKMTGPDTSKNISEKPSEAQGSVNDCCEFVKTYGIKGAIINGLLLWVDIKRQSTPADLWKEETINQFSKEEISDAKDTLWRTLGDSVIGKKITRKGLTKVQSDVNDICAAFKLLSEKEGLPLFLGTSTMVAQTPIVDKIKETNKQNGELTKLNDRIGSIEVVLKNLLTASTLGQTGERIAVTSVGDSSSGENNSHGLVAPIANKKINLPMDTINVEDIEGSTGNTKNEDSNWKTVGEKKKRQKKSWRDNLDILKGTGCADNSSSLLADKHLVAYGFAKNVTGVQISQWLSEKGLQVVDCELLTKYEGARSNTYKIVVKSTDFDKAKDPETWPSGVGVRLFKFFPNKKVREDVHSSQIRNQTKTPNKSVQFNLQNQYPQISRRTQAPNESLLSNIPMNSGVNYSLFQQRRNPTFPDFNCKNINQLATQSANGISSTLPGNPSYDITDLQKRQFADVVRNNYNPYPYEQGHFSPIPGLQGFSAEQHQL